MKQTDGQRQTQGESDSQTDRQSDRQSDRDSKAAHRQKTVVGTAAYVTLFIFRGIRNLSTPKIYK